MGAIIIPILQRRHRPETKSLDSAFQGLNHYTVGCLLFCAEKKKKKRLTNQWHLLEIYKYVLNLLIPLTPLPQITSEAMKDATALCCLGGQEQPWKISQGLLVELSRERSPGGSVEESGQKPGQGSLGGAGKVLQTIHQAPPPIQIEKPRPGNKRYWLPSASEAPWTLATPPGSSHYCSVPRGDALNQSSLLAYYYSNFAER